MKAGLAGRMPPSPCTGSIRKPAVCGPIAALTASRSSNSTTVKPGSKRREAVAHLGLVGGADRAQRAAVEGVGEGDQLVLLGPAVMMVVAARGLDRAFDRLDARIGEEDGVGEGEVDRAAARSASPCGLP